MIITRIHAGLGNQLFEYAAGRRLALKHKADLLLDIRGYETDKVRKYELDAFNIKARIATPEEIERIKRVNIYKEKTFGVEFDPTVLDLPDNTYLDGHLQNEKYFNDISHTILEEFTLINPTKRNVPQLGSIEAGSPSDESVALHIRRGDYAHDARISRYHPTMTLAYYQEASAFVAKTVKNPHFIIYSDDIEWAKSNLKLPYKMTFESSPNRTSSEELIQMSRASHFIIANSSFSWWAAWLGRNPDKVIVAPEYWFRREEMNKTSEIIPANWNKLRVPLVSIVMPVYNGGKYLRQAIDSILTQTFGRFEMVIVNDGSKDNSLEIMRSYSDPRIKIIDNPKNLGLIASLNIGLKAARADYIARMDQDDMALPERLKVLYEYLECHPDVVIVGSWAKLINKDNKQIGLVRKPIENISIRYELLYGNALIHPSIMMRKNAVLEAGGYSGKAIHAEDYDLYSRLANKGFILSNIEQTLLLYRQHGESITNADSTQGIQHESTRNRIRENISYYRSLDPHDEKLVHDVILARHPDPERPFRELMQAYRLHKAIYKSFIERERPVGHDIHLIKKYYRGRRNLMFKKYIIGKYKWIKKQNN